MSRVGKQPVVIPSGVTVSVSGSTVTVKGPKGELEGKVHPALSVEVKEQEVLVKRSTEEKFHRALHGLWRANIQNMVTGVSEGYERKLEINGVGFRAEVKGEKLNLLVGFSHPIVFGAPEGIKLEAPTQTTITVSGIDKQLVGLTAAKIRSFRPPEPYKGKGIRYAGEHVRRKAGKAAATAGAK